MKLVLSIDQMKHLKELGVDISKASMWWCRIVRPACPPTKKEKVMIDWFLSLRKEHMHTELDIVETIPAFTLDDIINLLPKSIYDEKSNSSASLYIDYEHEIVAYGITERYGFEVWCRKDIEVYLINSAYEMLCWVIENNYLHYE